MLRVPDALMFGAMFRLIADTVSSFLTPHYLTKGGLQSVNLSILEVPFLWKQNLSRTSRTISVVAAKAALTDPKGKSDREIYGVFAVSPYIRA